MTSCSTDGSRRSRPVSQPRRSPSRRWPRTGHVRCSHGTGWPACHPTGGQRSDTSTPHRISRSRTTASAAISARCTSPARASGSGSSNTRRGRPATIEIRLAWADDSGFDANSFRYVDWTAQDLGFPDGVMLDQTKIATSNDHVFLSINAFVDSTGRFTGGVVVRVPMDELVAGGAVAASCLSTVDPESGAEFFGMIPTRGAGDTMYLLGHVTRSQLGVFRWPDAAPAPSFHRVVDYDASGEAIKYPAAERYSCLRDGGAATSDWCVRPSTKGEPANDARPTVGVDRKRTRRGRVECEPGGHVRAIPVRVGCRARRGEAPVLPSGRMCASGTRTSRVQHSPSSTARSSRTADGALGAVALMGGGDRDAPLHGPGPAGWRDADRDMERFLEAGVSNADLPRPKSGDYLGLVTRRRGLALVARNVHVVQRWRREFGYAGPRRAVRIPARWPSPIDRSDRSRRAAPSGVRGRAFRELARMDAGLDRRARPDHRRAGPGIDRAAGLRGQGGDADADRDQARGIHRGSDRVER